MKQYGDEVLGDLNIGLEVIRASFQGEFEGGQRVLIGNLGVALKGQTAVGKNTRSGLGVSA